MRILSRLSTLALIAAFALPSASGQAAGSGLYVVQAGDTLFRIARSNELSVEALKELNRIQDNNIAVGQTLRLSDRVTVPAGGVTPQLPAGGQISVQVPTLPTRPDRPVIPTTPRAPANQTTNASTASTGSVHVVAPGETLFRIAMTYNTSVDEVRRLNGIDGDQIQVGQRLQVGGGVARPSSGGNSAYTPPTVRIAPPRKWSITDTTVPADQAHFVEPGETLYSIAAMFGVSVSDLTSSNPLSTAPLEPGTLLYLPIEVDPAVAVRQTLPMAEDSGLALVFPDVMRGRTTFSGENYDPLDLTASHREYPMGTLLLITNPASERSTFVRVIDRGPVSQNYLLEVSAAAATALELDPNVARRVEIRQVR